MVYTEATVHVPGVPKEVDFLNGYNYFVRCGIKMFGIAFRQLMYIYCDIIIVLFSQFFILHNSLETYLEIGLFLNFSVKMANFLTKDN